MIDRAQGLSIKDYSLDLLSYMLPTSIYTLYSQKYPLKSFIVPLREPLYTVVVLENFCN